MPFPANPRSSPSGSSPTNALRLRRFVSGEERGRQEMSPFHHGLAASMTGLQAPDQRKYGGEGGIRTLGTGVSPYNGLANRRIRPLCHLSGVRIYILPRLGQAFSRASVRAASSQQADRSDHSDLRRTVRARSSRTLAQGHRVLPSYTTAIDTRLQHPRRICANQHCLATYNDAHLFPCHQAATVRSTWNFLTPSVPSAMKSAITISCAIRNGGSFCVGARAFSAGIFRND